MPIYEYQCAKCARTFEVLVRSPREAVECPSCRGTKLTRQLSVFASGAPAPETSVSSAAAGDARFNGVCCGGACGCR